MDPSLENIASTRQPFHRRILDTVASRAYWVDATAAWIFYSPPYAMMEWLQGGMEGREIVQNRLEGLVVQAATMLPYRRYREWLADCTNITPNSPMFRKWLVDTGAVLSLQAPVYAAMLLCTGVSAEEFVLAYPAGLGLGIAMHGMFGYVVDQWRKLWGTKPTLYANVAPES